MHVALVVFLLDGFRFFPQLVLVLGLLSLKNVFDKSFFWFLFFLKI